MPIQASSTDDLDVTIRCQQHRATYVRLHSRYAPDQWGVGFAIDAQADGLHAQLHGIEVWTYDDVWLSDFITELAADYPGWLGQRVWQTNHLSVHATFHTGGHVELVWNLRPRLVRPDTWHASLATWLEAGEQMRNLAADLHEFLARPPLSRTAHPAAAHLPGDHPSAAEDRG